MKKGKRIAEGRTAEIFLWGEREIVKLFRAGWDRRSAEQEMDVASRVWAAGVPVPAVRGIVQVEGRPGIVYERIEGPTMGMVLGPTNVVLFARQLAELHVRLHECRVDGLPSLRARLAKRIEDVAAQMEPNAASAAEVLAELPEDDMLCHGDFHPHNVLLSAEGPIVIDWNDAASGHPDADVARTCLLIGNSPFYHQGRMRRAFTRVGAQVFLAVYLRRYLELRPGSRDEIAAWTVPVAAARLSEHIREEETTLRRIVEKAAQRRTRP